jgi:hypothetical protein
MTIQSTRQSEAAVLYVLLTLVCKFTRFHTLQGNESIKLHSDKRNLVYKNHFNIIMSFLLNCLFAWFAIPEICKPILLAMHATYPSTQDVIALNCLKIQATSKCVCVCVCAFLVFLGFLSVLSCKECYCVMKLSEFAFPCSVLTVPIAVRTACVPSYAEACQAASCARRITQWSATANQTVCIEMLREWAVYRVHHNCCILCCTGCTITAV